MPEGPDKALYLVTFHIAAMVRLRTAETLKFNLPHDVEVAVRNGPGPAPDIPEGLLAAVLCTSDGLRAALRVATQQVEFICDTLSISVSASTGPCLPLYAIQLVRDAAQLRFLQRVYVPPSLRLSRDFRKSAFASLWPRLDAAPGALQGRLRRAISWYRKALEDTNTFDQFANFWTGLEALDKVVKVVHGLPGSDRVAVNCESCGAPIDKVATQKGIDYVLRTLLHLDADTVRRIRETRRGLLHSYEDISSISTDVSTFAPLMQRALLVGILDALGVPPEERDALVRPALPNKFLSYAEVEGSVRGVKADDIMSGKVIPTFTVTLDPGTPARTEDGRMIRQVTNMRFRLAECPGCVVHVDRVNVITSKDPEDNAASTTFEVSKIDPGTPTA